MKATRFAGAMATAGALGLFLLATAARADEAEIPLGGLPKAVTDAAKAKFPGAEWREAGEGDRGRQDRLRGGHDARRAPDGRDVPA